VVLACGVLELAAQAPPPVVTPAARAAGPLPVTSASYPFLAAHRLAEPMDLAAAGYVEEEFLVSGIANVYDWPVPGALTVAATDAPYTTRILVRRPASAARFSGTVVVELMHAPRGVDFPLMWGWAHGHWIERGDAWVGLTFDPAAARSLQKFNPARYAPLSWRNPRPAEECADGARGDHPAERSDVEEGLRWDVISQLGALLKTGDGRTLGGVTARYLYLTTQDAAHLTYINAIQPHVRLADGGPVYDGHLTKSGRRAARIRRCAPVPPPDDPRHVVRNVGVPVINVLQEGDVLGGLLQRRPDNDASADRYRLYEVAGTAHSGVPPYRWSTATMEDHIAAGGEVVTRAFSAAIAPYTLAVPLRDPRRCQPTEIVTEQPIVTYTFHSAFANLDAWVRTGTAPPRAGRIEVADTGTSQPRVVKDRFGNATGGVRTPWVDVPAATYHVGHGTGPGCGQNFGYSEPFQWGRLEALYGSYRAYVSRMTEAVDRAVQERWLTAADARQITAELQAALMEAVASAPDGRR
jgi:hypothetical protein